MDDGAPLIDRVMAAAGRIRDHVVETPVEHSVWLSRLADAQVYLKLENVQRTGSFKLRGAMNKILTLSEEQRRAGVVAASTGNHGLAVADALGRVGCTGTIFLPERPAAGKLGALRELGARLEFFGQDCEQTERFAREQAGLRGQAFVSPYNDLEVIAGQGTIGVELGHQLPGCEAVFTSVGGGGLAAGVGTSLKAQNPAARLVGCWPRNSPALYECLRAGRIIEWPSQPTLSDGTAGGVEPGAITFELCRELLDDHVLVDEEQIREAIRLVVEHHRLVIEGAAGVAVAGFVQQRERYAGKTVVIVLCGRNIELAQLRACLGTVGS